ncbi:MAG: hypothetical protein HC927_03530 [Deltaproteobacteria bacterium]|nr:hypothetical protein [Deltaproteobacteria bacterium]
MIQPDPNKVAGLPERGTPAWYLYKRKLRETGRRGGRMARFREIARYKKLSIEDTLAGQLDPVFESEYRYFVWNVEPVLCAYCNTRLTKQTRTRDHVVPRSRGGGNRDNLVPACGGCNRAKGDKPLLAWLIQRS